MIFILVLSNADRRKHYDKYGTVMDDNDSEEAYFKDFENMFNFGSGGFDFFNDFEAFSEFLESDNKFMKNMFKDLGNNYRVRGGGTKRKK